MKNRILQIPSKLVVFFIRCYQVALSPLFPGVCRFEPTCSQYAIIAVRKYGCFKGARLAIKRICRCRPGGAHGYDPVP